MTREEAIKLIGSMKGDLCDFYDDDDLTALEMAISALSENKGEWNPLKSDEEGMIIGSLPEEGEEVLVTVYGQVEIDSFGCDVEYDESVGECKCEWFCENNDIEDVRAWMPLPEPYMENENQTEKDILHKAIDNTKIAEDVYPNLRKELHEAVDSADMRGE